MGIKSVQFPVSTDRVGRLTEQREAFLGRARVRSSVSLVSEDLQGPAGRSLPGQFGSRRALTIIFVAYVRASELMIMILSLQQQRVRSAEA